MLTSSPSMSHTLNSGVWCVCWTVNVVVTSRRWLRQRHGQFRGQRVAARQTTTRSFTSTRLFAFDDRGSNTKTTTVGPLITNVPTYVFSRLRSVLYPTVQDSKDRIPVGDGMLTENNPFSPLEFRKEHLWRPFPRWELQVEALRPRLAQHGQCWQGHQRFPVLRHYCRYSVAGRQTCRLWKSSGGDGGCHSMNFPIAAARNMFIYTIIEIHISRCYSAR